MFIIWMTTLFEMVLHTEWIPFFMFDAITNYYCYYFWCMSNQRVFIIVLHIRVKISIIYNDLREKKQITEAVQCLFYLLFRIIILFFVFLFCCLLLLQMLWKMELLFSCVRFTWIFFSFFQFSVELYSPKHIYQDVMPIADVDLDALEAIYINFDFPTV